MYKRGGGGGGVETEERCPSMVDASKAGVDGIPTHGGGGGGGGSVASCCLKAFIIVHPCASSPTPGLFDNEVCIRKLVPGDRVGMLRLPQNQENNSTGWVKMILLPRLKTTGAGDISSPRSKGWSGSRA